MDSDLFKNLDHFLRPDSKVELTFKNLTKELFDDVQQQKSKNLNKPCSNHLVVDFMDDEAIWTQLDEENQEFLKSYVEEFCQNEKPDEEDNFVNNDSMVYDTDDSMNEDNDEQINNSNDEELDDEELDDELDDEELDEELDDEEINDLNDEESEDENLLDEDEMNEDLLNDDSELDDESGDDTLFNPKSNQINYDKELEDMGDDDDEDEEQIDEMISEFQKEDAKTQQKVKELEEEYLKEKPWQLKGEISATDRPQDSLLQEYVDFETGIRPLPIYTEEFTQKLEEIILQRIKTNKYDDVEKKERKTEQPFDFKRRLILETEQNKDGLAKVYENEFLKKKGSSSKEENPLHKEIKEKMRKLFVQLDSLCNFNYIPRASNSEIKIVNNLPAIQVEEAIPDAVSDANLIAPQEIIPVQKKDLKAEIEKTKTDKLRERRVKKQMIKEKIKFKEQNGQLTNFKKFKSDKKASNNDKTNDKSVHSNKQSEAVKNVFMKTRKNR